MALDTFSSPTMRARAALVRALSLTDDMERAYYRRDNQEVTRLANALRDEAMAIRLASLRMESWDGPEADRITARPPSADATTYVAAPADGPGLPESEPELRLAHGDR